VVQRLDAAPQRGMAKDAVRQRIDALGMNLAVEDPAGFRRALRDETALWSRFVQRAGILPPRRSPSTPRALSPTAIR
jgi:tripartite-type tricarboxylate transporter receptor subunit TctC